MRVVNEGDLIQADKSADYKNFIDKLSEFRQIYDIIENSPYDMLTTLEKLIDLKKSKNLKIQESDEQLEGLYIEDTKETGGLVERLLTADEVNLLRESLNATELSSGKLMVIGSNTCGKTEFIRQFNQGSTSGVRTNQELDFTKTELAEDFYLLVFGIALDKKLMEIIEKLSEGLVGYVFLVDAKRPEDFEYTNYLISHLIGMYKVPWSVAVTNLEEKDSKKIMQKIKKSIQSAAGRELMICNVDSKEDVKQTVLGIKPADGEKENG